MSDSFAMIAKTFFGLEGVLADELEALGATGVRRGRRMVAFDGDLAMLYRASLHCRTAVRVLKPIHAFTASDEKELYRGIGDIDWRAYLDANDSLAIDPVVHSPIFTNSLYAAQLAKDAIVDQFREATGQRPSVDLVDPQLRINLHVDADRVTVYLDASGDSLHKRGYRTAAGEAPLNEVLAAGILRLTGWDRRSPLVDFMCGSGTLVIEAALAARQIAPGLVRPRFGYMRWKDFDRPLHDSLLDEARQQVLPNLTFPLQGSDLDPTAIAAAAANAQRAGVAGDITWLVESFEAVAPPAPLGTLVANPPYDERMKTEQIAAVYRRIGNALKRRWPDYTAHLLTGNLEAAKQIGLRTSSRIRLFNGPIECRLLKFVLTASTTPSKENAPQRRAPQQAAEFRNRLARMARHWHRWARRQGITCYRIYDRDIPDVPLSIDWYEGRAIVGRYRRRHARTEIEERGWLDEMLRIVGEVLELPPDRVMLARTAPGRDRKSQKGPAPVTVHEGGLCLEAHLDGSAETGLPVDLRVLRARVRGEAAGKRFLNLFARSGVVSLAAAAGGAGSTTSVDASQQHIEWARRNFRLNDFDMRDHEFICRNPIEFALDPQRPAPGSFDLIYVEPPSFDGRRRPGVWNVQDGHAELLERLVEWLAPLGRIYFVSRFRRLKLDASGIAAARVREITRQTVPPDFRNRKIHRAWVVMRPCDRGDTP